jgi:hypothetical protein
VPLRFASEPRNGAALVRSHLEKLTSRPGPPGALGASAAALALASPHPVFDLRADEVAAGGGLETARQTGFRYLVTSGNSVVAAAEIQTDSSGTATRLANVNYGRFAAATADSLPRLATSAAVGGALHEVRLLRFSAIYLMAIWLKSDSGGADMIVPIAPAPDGLEPNRAYAVSDFLNIIRPMAAKRTATSGTSSVP